MAVRPFSDGEGAASCDAWTIQYKTQPLSGTIISSYCQWKYQVQFIFSETSDDFSETSDESATTSSPEISNEFSSTSSFLLRRNFKMSSAGYNSSRGRLVSSSSSEDHQSLVPYCFRNSVTSPEQLHYSLGKTIGSGTYAKVKAAWSPYERKMVSPSHFLACSVCT